MTLKERITYTRGILGNAKADAVIKVAEERKAQECNGYSFLTLKETLTCLEEAVRKESGKQTPPRTVVGAAAAAAAPGSDSNTAVSAIQLCNQYGALESEQDRRAFYNANRQAISKIGGLVQICMAAGIPLTPRAFASVATPLAGQVAGIDKATAHFAASLGAKQPRFQLKKPI